MNHEIHERHEKEEHTEIATVHTFCRLFYFAPSGLKMFACFVTQGVALG